jgi:hypothetical protein
MPYPQWQGWAMTAFRALRKARTKALGTNPNLVTLVQG